MRYASVRMHWRHMVASLCICVCICVYLYMVYVCNSDFLKVTKPKRWQMQYRHSATIPRTYNVIVVKQFWKKALLTIYGMICSPWMPLWHVPDSPEDNLLATDLATWNLDQYNRYSCWQQNYAITMLPRTSHNNFATCPDCQELALLIGLLKVINARMLLTTHLPTSTICLHGVL